MHALTGGLHSTNALIIIKVPRELGVKMRMVENILKGQFIMRLIYCLALICIMSVGLSPRVQASSVNFEYGSFTDTSRDNRVVPYKVYYHHHIPKPAPVVIFSHGLGGSVEAAEYLGLALAMNGYVAFFIQHEGTDKSLWEGTTNPMQIKRKLGKSTKDFRSAIDRYKDVPFVIDELVKLYKKNGPLMGKLDLNHIGMAGHSYGARSVLMAAGESMPMVGTKMKEPRIKAAVALSPNLPQRAMKKEINADSLYGAIDIPIFHMTGTEDGYPLADDFDPATRTLPYQGIKASNQYLLVLGGANHAAFGGGTRKGQPNDPRWQEAVANGTVLFFDAYLKNDANAKMKLQHEYARSLKPTDRFEYK